MEEIWKPVKGFENLYKISNKGDIIRLPKITEYIDGRKRHRKEKTLNPCHKNGYLMVRLFKEHDQVGKLYQVHRLIMEAFVENPGHKPFIDHINTVRDDNRLENLRWCTAAENAHNPITLERNRHSSIERWNNKENRKKMSLISKKRFSDPVFIRKFKERMKSKEVIEKMRRTPCCKPVVRLNLDGEIIAQYRSTCEASRKTGYSQTAISKWCRHHAIRNLEMWKYNDTAH